MPDFRGDVGAAGDLENFFHRIVDGVGFAALVRDVDAAVLMRDFRQFDDLIGFRKTRRHVLQRSRNSERAVFHRVGDQLLHLLQLGRRGRAIVIADDVLAHLGRAHERAEVDAGALFSRRWKYSPSVRQSMVRLKRRLKSSCSLI